MVLSHNDKTFFKRFLDPDDDPDYHQIKYFRPLCHCPLHNIKSYLKKQTDRQTGAAKKIIFGERSQVLPCKVILQTP